MRWEITEGSAFPLLKFDLEIGEAVKAQSGGMMAMSDGLQLSGKVDGGISKAIGRMFSGESFFLQKIKAREQAGWVLFAPEMPGEIAYIEIKPGQEITVQKDGFLTGTSGIEVSTKVQGLIKGLLGGEGLFVVKISGSGTAFLQTYGAIYAIDVAEGKEVIVDNGHLVAWEASLKYEITKATSNWLAALTSGSGFVCKFKGPGRIWTQTRNPTRLANWIQAYLPKQQGKSE